MDRAEGGRSGGRGELVVLSSLGSIRGASISREGGRRQLTLI